MKILGLYWRDPHGNLVTEKMKESDGFKVHTEPGWLKLNGKDGAIRYIPSHLVALVEFIEQSDEPRILRPDQIESTIKSVPS